MSGDLDFDKLADVLRRTDAYTPRETAQGLARLGIPVLPTVPGDKPPMLTERHIDGIIRKTGEVVGEPCPACNAAGLTPTAQHGATVDLDVIELYWSVHPDAGVGMRGHPQMVRGDADFASAKEMKAAWKAIGYGQPNGEPWPYQAPTPGGQYRRRFIHSLPEGVPAPGGGTRALGVAWYGDYTGFVVVQGGHREGGSYSAFQGNEITPLPAALVKAFQARSTDSSSGTTERAASTGEVKEFFAKHTGTGDLAALDNRRRRVEALNEGERHHGATTELVHAFRDAIVGRYPAQLAHDVIRDGLVTAGWDDARFRSEWAGMVSWAVAQVANSTPAEILEAETERRDKWLRTRLEEPSTGADVAVASGHEPGDLVRESCSGVDGYRYTDLGNARRLIDAHRDHLRFVPKWRRWLVYDRGRWRVDDADTLARHLASRIGAGLLTTEHFATIKADPDPARQKARMEALIRWAQRSENRSGVDGTIAAAASLPGVAIHHDALDADPWVLNCRNGTLELRTGRLRRHDPADLLTLMADVDYDPEADAEQFDRFLAEVLPDEQVRRFVQRLAGVVLVGEQIEHVLPIALGGGANGKSSLTQIVAAVLGDYAVAAAPDLLLAARQDTHPTTRATLFRRRFAHSGELPPGAKVDEAQVKRLTGGDAISARRMREDEWQFVPSHTLWLHANHRPSIAGTDEGIWRRVVLIPFDVAIPPERRDPHLAERIIRDESPGVLRWMIDGLRDYLEVGLAPPAAVTIATTDYRSQSDTARRFLDDVSATFDPGRWVSAGDLMTVHSEWFRTAGAVGHGTEAAHYQLVTTLLKSQGCSNGRSRTRGGGYWQGVGLDD